MIFDKVREIIADQLDAVPEDQLLLLHHHLLNQLLIVENVGPKL